MPQPRSTKREHYPTGQNSQQTPEQLQPPVIGIYEYPAPTKEELREFLGSVTDDNGQ
jgi:hypothetical protein